MLCKFCGRQVDNGLTECPYCHYVFEQTPVVLSKAERDNFEGTTIEDDGYAHTSEDDYRDSIRDKFRQHRNGFEVHSIGCGLGSFGVLLAVCLMISVGLALLPYILLTGACIAGYYWLKRRF